MRFQRSKLHDFLCHLALKYSIQIARPRHHLISADDIKMGKNYPCKMVSRANVREEVRR